MVSYLILCRSLTYAPRTAGVLERSGIKGRVARLPHSIAGEGCGYCVRVGEHSFDGALRSLREDGMSPKRVYRENADGSFVEVTL